MHTEYNRQDWRQSVLKEEEEEEECIWQIFLDVLYMVQLDVSNIECYPKSCYRTDSAFKITAASSADVPFLFALKNHTQKI